MSHACIDLTFLPSGRLMVRGFVATCLFATSTPSITKMDVAPVSATVWFGTMVIALIYCGFWRLLVAKFDMTTITSSWSATETTFMFSMGFRTEAETKLLHLCAVNAPRPRPPPRLPVQPLPSPPCWQPPPPQPVLYMLCVAPAKDCCPMFWIGGI